MEYLGWWIMLASFFVLVVIILAFAVSRSVRCPLCGKFAKDEGWHTIMEPTDLEAGLEKCRYICEACGYEFFRTKKIPKLGMFTSGARFYDYERRTALQGPTEAIVNWRSASSSDWFLMFGGGESGGSGSSNLY